MDVHGKTALVTGGARRVGRAIGCELAQCGANVVVHCRRSQAEADATCAVMRAYGVGASVVVGDLGNVGDVSRIADEAEAAFGTIDVLVNNASTFLHTPIETLSPDTWDRVLSVNLKGPFLLAVRLGRAMREREGGVIVNIGDWAGLRPYCGYLPYCVSKAGIVALTTGLAKALAPKVRVNCVAPGPVLPPENYTAAERAQLMQLTPLQRLGSPEDVARMVRFLVTEADFSTGGVYLVDGGRLNASGISQRE
jgi:NAD(P)-dependent dehydrogenase (short-subunit alcohol dehydrogenase family)